MDLKNIPLHNRSMPSLVQEVKDLRNELDLLKGDVRRKDSTIWEGVQKLSKASARERSLRKKIVTKKRGELSAEGKEHVLSAALFSVFANILVVLQDFVARWEWNTKTLVQAAMTSILMPVLLYVKKASEKHEEWK